MRWGRFLTTVGTVLTGFLAGVLTVQTFAPDLLNQSRAAEMPEEITAQLLGSGDFRDTSTIHKARGRVQLLDSGTVRVLRFTGFEVSNGPHLEVWLSKGEGIASSRDVRAADVYSLGPLDRMRGEQIYVLPEGLDTGTYRTVLIWSVEFGTLYGMARLES